MHLFILLAERRWQVMEPVLSGELRFKSKLGSNRGSFYFGILSGMTLVWRSILLKDVLAMDGKLTIILAIGVGAAVIALYIMHTRDNFISTTYGVSCAQLCGIAHPQGVSSCETSPLLQECVLHQKCVSECREDQKNLEQEFGGSHDWSGPYGKLI